MDCDTVLEMLMRQHARERCILVKGRSFIFVCRFSILKARGNRAEIYYISALLLHID